MEKVCGIYRLVCVKNGDYYYGSAKDIHGRWLCHRRELRHGKHFNPRVQRVWNKYTEQSFRIETAEIVSEDKLLEVEDKYLKEHVGKPHCMNIAKYATAFNRGRTFVCSESTKKKISDANRGKPLSEEHKAALRRGAINRKSSPCSEEKKRKIRDAQKGKPRLYLKGVCQWKQWAIGNPEKYIARCQEARDLKLGIPLTAELKQKISAGLQRYHIKKNAAVKVEQVRIYKRLQSELNRPPWKIEWRNACKEESVSTEISRDTSPFTSYKELREFVTGIAEEPAERKRQIQFWLNAERLAKGIAHPSKGRKLSEEQKRKISEGVKRTKAILPKVSHKHSDEAKKKIGNAHRGKKHSDITKEKMRKSQTGRKQTPEHREQNRQTLLKWNAERKAKGIPHPNAGRKLTNAQIQHLREVNRGRLYDQAFRDKVSKQWKGVPKSEEQKRKISESEKRTKGLG